MTLNEIKAAAEAKDGLLPCPFCGGDDIQIDANAHEDGRFRFQPWCDDCGARRDGKATLAEAIAAWNKRTPAVPAMYDVIEWLIKEGGHYTEKGRRIAANKILEKRLDKPE